MGQRLDREFYRRDVLEVAPALLGKHLVIPGSNGSAESHLISETEAYRGPDDLACHASRGRTARTSVMFGDGGHLYIYLIYGIHWMMNVVTSVENEPQAVLLRGIREAEGPGRLTRLLGIDRTFNGVDLVDSDRVWIEDTGMQPGFRTGPRVGIDYAGEPWKDLPWRFMLTV